MIRRAHLFMLLLLIYMRSAAYALAYAVRAAETLFSIRIDAPAVQGVSVLLSFGVPLAAYMAATKEKPADVLPRAPLDIVNACLMIVIGFTAIPAMMALSAAASYAFPNNAAVFLELSSGRPVLIVLLSAAVLPAVFEELVFRGIILSSVKELGIKKAACLSGFFFGLAHMDLQQLPYAFVMGVLFAYLVRYAGSVYASMLTHFTVNAAMIILNYTVITKITPSLWLIPAICAATPVCATAFIVFIKYNAQRAPCDKYYADTSARISVFTREFWALLFVFFVVLVV